jgi:N-acyl-D-amino-acid deacylase
VLSVDLAIENGLIVDGSGSPWYRANLSIKNDVIAAISRLKIKEARQVIDAKGHVISPGFIDMHSHSDLTLMAGADAESKIRQGVTTEVIGNCGESAAPLEGEAVEVAQAHADEYGLKVTWSSLAGYMKKLERLGVVLNVACLIGHGTVRSCVIGFENRAPTPSEMRRMQEHVTVSMQEGAFGFSSGLFYAPGCYAKLDELVALARVVAKFGGFYASHIRDESDGLEKATDEAIAVGIEAGIPVQPSHHKACGERNWGKVKRTLRKIAIARRNGFDVTVDVYPYTAYNTSLSAAIPPWAHEGGDERLVGRLKNQAVRRKLKRDMQAGSRSWESMTKGRSWDRFMISSFAEKPSLVGKTIEQISRKRRCDPYDAIFDMLIEGNAMVGVVVEDMNEQDVQLVLQSPFSMIGSDGESMSTRGLLGKGKPHPRSFGTFPRVLGRYVRQKHVLGLEEAIRKMTAFPANRLGLRNRGLLRQGMKADIVIFNPATIVDTATYLQPKRFPVGIEYVIVNGKVTVSNGKYLKRLNGRVLKHHALDDAEAKLA